MTWRRFKEWLHRPVCWWKGGHSPTMLEDDETIYCERCGKVLGSFVDGAYVKKGERVPSAIPEKIAKRGFVVRTGETKIRLAPKTPDRTLLSEIKEHGKEITTAREKAKKLLAEVDEEIRRTGRLKRPVATSRMPSKEEVARKRWIPEPTTRRRTRTHKHTPPAERHRKAISKHMKGKGRSSSSYRRTIKKSPNVPIEEDD